MTQVQTGVANFTTSSKSVNSSSVTLLKCAEEDKQHLLELLGQLSAFVKSSQYALKDVNVDVVALDFNTILAQRDNLLAYFSPCLVHRGSKEGIAVLTFQRFAGPGRALVLPQRRVAVSFREGR